MLDIIFVTLALLSFLIVRLGRLKRNKYKTCVRIDGKVAIVTGGSSGIGYHAAKELAARGARVILACRDVTKGLVALENIIDETGNRAIFCYYLDLTSLRSIHRFIYEIMRSESRIDILINIAATANSLSPVLTEDRLPKEVQINYFGMYFLTVKLMEVMKYAAPSRIINVSSVFHKFGQIDLTHFDRAPNNFFFRKRSYCDAKLATIMFTMKLHRYLEGSGVTANCVATNFVDTEYLRKLCPKMSLLITLLFGSTMESAQAIVYLAVAPELMHVSGKYFEERKEASPAASALDQRTADRLWNLSMRRTGLLEDIDEI